MTEYMAFEFTSVEVQGAHEIGGRALGGAPPCLVDSLWAPWSWFFRQKFWLNLKSASVDFQDIPRTFLFYT